MKHGIILKYTGNLKELSFRDRENQEKVYRVRGLESRTEAGSDLFYK